MNNQHHWNISTFFLTVDDRPGQSCICMHLLISSFDQKSWWKDYVITSNNQTPIYLSSYKETTLQKTNKLHHLYWNNSCLWSLIPPRSIQEVPCFSLVKSLESKGFPTEIHHSHVEKILLLHSPCSFIWVAPKNGRHPWRNVHNIGSNLGLLESRCLLDGCSWSVREPMRQIYSWGSGQDGLGFRVSYYITIYAYQQSINSTAFHCLCQGSCKTLLKPST